MTAKNDNLYPTGYIYIVEADVLSEVYFSVCDEDKLEVYEGEQLVLVADGAEFKRQAPEWTGTIGLGDIITANEEKKRILEISIAYLDERKTAKKYKIVIG
jgi:hypothetical protein